MYALVLMEALLPEVMEHKLIHTKLSGKHLMLQVMDQQYTSNQVRMMKPRQVCMQQRTLALLLLRMVLYS